MIFDKSFGKYLEEAIGHENALIAFSAFAIFGEFSLGLK